jgi:hypothetical protein
MKATRALILMVHRATPWPVIAEPGDTVTVLTTVHPRVFIGSAPHRNRDPRLNVGRVETATLAKWLYEQSKRGAVEMSVTDRRVFVSALTEWEGVLRDVQTLQRMVE